MTPTPPRMDAVACAGICRMAGNIDVSKGRKWL